MIQDGGFDAQQAGNLLLGTGETPSKCTCQQEEILSFKLVMRNHVKFIAADGPDLLLHLRICER